MVAQTLVTWIPVINARVALASVMTTPLDTWEPLLWVPLVVNSLFGIVLLTFAIAPTPLAVEVSANIFLTEASPAVWKVLAGAVDPFYLWSLALLTTGHAVLMRLPFRTGLICSAVIFALRLGISLVVVA